jgi:chromosome segregation ATPase
VAFQVEDKAQYEAELDQLTQQSAAIDTELQSMMQLKMGLYAELRRASQYNTVVKPPGMLLSELDKKSETVEPSTSKQSTTQLALRAKYSDHQSQIEQIDSDIEQKCLDKSKSYNKIQQIKQQIFNREMSLNLLVKNI